MGYWGNRAVYATMRFVPTVTPLDVAVPPGADGLYVSWLFNNVVDRVPDDLFTAIQSDTVARFSLGYDGAYVGLVDVRIDISFENLGTPARFGVTGEFGFELNTVSETILNSITKFADAANQLPFTSVTLNLENSDLSYASISAVQPYLDAAIRITHEAGSSRTIRVGYCDIVYRQIERRARDA